MRVVPTQQGDATLKPGTLTGTKPGLLRPGAHGCTGTAPCRIVPQSPDATTCRALGARQGERKVLYGRKKGTRRRIPTSLPGPRPSASRAAAAAEGLGLCFACVWILPFLPEGFALPRGRPALQGRLWQVRLATHRWQSMCPGDWLLCRGPPSQGHDKDTSPSSWRTLVYLPPQHLPWRQGCGCWLFWGPVQKTSELIY